MSVVSKREASAEAVAGEFEFTQEDFREIASMLRGETGISLPNSKAQLVYSRLARRLRDLHLRSFRDYRALLKDGQAERKRMFVALTTNVTRFFREPHHFTHLQNSALPGLIAAAKAGKRVRIWSAACSSGEEPYTIALCILAMCPDAARYDIKILATDLSTDMIAKAKRGCYDAHDLDTVADDLKRKWFAPAASAGEWEVSQDLRSLISFREHNLMGSWPMRGQFDIIVCRNVVIYFEAETQATLWGRFVAQLRNQGWLYIGHSERISGPATDLVRSCGTTVYTKQGPNP